MATISYTIEKDTFDLDSNSVNVTATVEYDYSRGDSWQVYLARCNSSQVIQEQVLFNPMGTDTEFTVEFGADKNDNNKTTKPFELDTTWYIGAFLFDNWSLYHSEYKKIKITLPSPSVSVTVNTALENGAKLDIDDYDKDEANTDGKLYFTTAYTDPEVQDSNFKNYLFAYCSTSATSYTLTGIDKSTKFYVYVYDKDWDVYLRVDTVTITPIVKELTDLRVDVYVENADDDDYSFTGGTFNYNQTYYTGDTVNLSTFANTVLNDLKSDYGFELFNQINYSYALVDGSEETSFVVEDSWYGIDLFFDRKTYSLTLSKGAGVSSFLINNSTPKSKYKYNQTLVATANMSTNYKLDFWHSNPVISGLDYSTSNPSPAFQMPGQALSLQAVGVYVAPEYDFELWIAYQNIDNDGYTASRKINTTYEEGTSIPLSSYKNTYAKTGFSWKETQVNDVSTTSSSISLSKDTIVYIYYTRNTYSITVDGDDGVYGFYVNNEYKNKGSTISPYKYEQKVTLVPLFYNGYIFDSWDNDDFSGMTEEVETVEIPAFNSSVYVYSKSSLAMWKWEPEEISAFEGSGAFSTLTADRWNEFLDWCNGVIEIKGGDTIGNTYYGTKNQPLYASHFEHIIDCLSSVATLPANIPTSYSKGDIVKGSYFIDMADAMNDIL